MHWWKFTGWAATFIQVRNQAQARDKKSTYCDGQYRAWKGPIWCYGMVDKGTDGLSFSYDGRYFLPSCNGKCPTDWPLTAQATQFALGSGCWRYSNNATGSFSEHQTLSWNFNTSPQLEYGWCPPDTNCNNKGIRPSPVVNNWSGGMQMENSGDFAIYAETCRYVTWGYQYNVNVWNRTHSTSWDGEQDSQFLTQYIHTTTEDDWSFSPSCGFSYSKTDKDG